MAKPCTHRVPSEANTPAPRDVLVGRFQLLSRLADDIAHEIKNPLHAMVVNLEVLKRRVIAEDAPAALERAAVLETELRRVNRLVHQLLTLLRPPPDVARSLDVNESVEELLPILEALARAARRPFRYGAVGTGIRASIRPDALGLALVAGVAEIVAASPAGAGIAVDARADSTVVRLVVRPEPGPDRRDDATTGVSGSIEPGSTIAIADALLREAGGTLTPQPGESVAFCITIARADGA